MSQLPPTPVFNCVVNVSPPADGVVIARVANLGGIEGRGRTEREALTQAVAAFKSTVAKHHASGKPIPWLTETVQPQPGEKQRFVAVHL